MAEYPLGLELRVGRMRSHLRSGLKAFNQKGFTSLEVLLAATVFGMAVVAIGGVLVYGRGSGAYAGNRMRAIALADEGIEAVRNMRDGVGLSGLADGTYGLAQSGESARANWYNAGYLYRIPITVDHTKVSGGANLTDFPVLVSTTQADLKTVANGGSVQNSNGYDMVFTASDGTTALSFETESYDASTGQLIAWVKVPTLSSTTDTVLYLYYDNSSITGFQGNASGVWSANYGAVYHLDETATGAAGEYKDSTANANNGQGGAGSTSKLPTNAAGEIGASQSFSGSQTIYMSSMTGVPALDSTAQTLSWWYKVGTNPTTTQSVISLINSGNSAANQGEFRGGALGMGQWGGAMTVSSTPLAANSWHYVAWVHSGSTSYLYFDGTQVATSTAALQTGAVGQLILSGYDTVPNEGYVGQLDEVSIAGTARTAGWIATAYNNQGSPSTFAALGSAESSTAPAGGYWMFSGTSDVTGIFTRQVVISSSEPWRKTVSVTVSWNDGASAKQVSATDQITTWPAAFKSWSLPTVLGSVNTSGTTDGLKVATQGVYAYMVINTTNPGLIIFNIANPAAPTQVGTAALSGAPTNIAVSGNYAYITDSANTGELLIYNVSNPASPTLAYTYNAAGNADGRSVKIVGNYAYLVRGANAGNHEFEILNITTPTAPTLVGFYSNNLTMNDIYVTNNRAYIVTSSGTMLILNVATPSSPVLNRTYTLSGTGSAACITGFGTALLVGKNTALQAYNITNPTTPTLYSTLTIGSTVNSIAFNEAMNRAYVGNASTTTGLRVVNITSLTAMSIVASLSAGGGAGNGVAYTNMYDLLVVASSSNTQEFLVVGPS